MTFGCDGQRMSERQTSWNMSVYLAVYPYLYIYILAVTKVALDEGSQRFWIDRRRVGRKVVTESTLIGNTQYAALK